MPNRHSQAGSTLIWLIIWLVGMAAIAYWCVAKHVPALQQQITSNAQAAVISANAGDIDVSVDGRTATLAGVVVSEVQKDQLINVVADADGIRHVNDQLTLIGQASTETNVIKTEADDVVAVAQLEASTDAVENNPELAAEMPPKNPIANTESAEQPVEVVINEADEKERVTDESIDATTDAANGEPTNADIQIAELVVNPELPTNTDVSTALSADAVDARALALIEQARKETANSLIDPQTPRPDNNLALQEAANSLSSAQSSVAITEQPTLKMQAREGTLTLTGEISDQDSLSELIRSAMNTFDTSYVINSVQVNEQVATADWLPALSQFLPDMNSISNAGIDIIESQITLSGEAVNDQQHDEVIDNALIVLSDLSLVERISIDTEAKSNVTDSTENATPPVEESQITKASDEPAAETQRQTLKEAFESLQTGKILFQSGSDVLTEESLQVIESIAKVFAQYPSTSIEIDGHTDASGVSANNLKLSQLRANAVRDYLVKQGIAAERMSAYGFGDGVPIADNSTAAGRRLNRRIEFNF